VVSVQNPVPLGLHREPELDLVLLKPRADFYDSRMPTPAGVVLLVEIADCSLEYDRDTKALLYAEDGIVDYWLVNLIDDVVLVYRDPSPTGYRSVQTFRRGDEIRPLAFPDVASPSAASSASRPDPSRERPETG
jgi:Uma2 family endonuclease